MTLLQRRDPGAACCTTAPDLPTELWAQIVILGAPDLVDGFLVPSSALGSVSRACALGMADARERMLDANRAVMRSSSSQLRCLGALLAWWTRAVEKADLKRVRALDVAWRSFEAALPKELEINADRGVLLVPRTASGDVLRDFRTCVVLPLLEHDLTEDEEHTRVERARALLTASAEWQG